MNIDMNPKVYYVDITGKDGKQYPYRCHASSRHHVEEKARRIIKENPDRFVGMGAICQIEEEF